LLSIASSISINAPLAKLVDVLADFRQWPAWSAAIQAACPQGHKPVIDPVGIERYHNDHETLPAAQLITEVIVPVA